MGLTALPLFRDGNDGSVVRWPWQSLGHTYFFLLPHIPHLNLYRSVFQSTTAFSIAHGTQALVLSHSLQHQEALLRGGRQTPNMQVGTN